jgi:photosystem II stability/assembly factor-like uncharacterized protein
MTANAIVSRNEDVESLVTFDVQGEPPLDIFHSQLGRRQSSFAGTTAVNDVWFNSTSQCSANCGTTYKAGDLGVAVVDAVALATAKVYFTLDAGSTWTAAGADPFAADIHIGGVTAVYIGNFKQRTIVATESTSVAGSQGQIAYADHTIGTIPTSWTVVNVGGAAAGHGVVLNKGLFALNGNKENIWLATSGGFIYKSEDSGVTWDDKESGTIHAGNYNSINFIDDSYGVAVGDADIVAVTTDGENWAAASATGSGAALNACAQLNNTWLWAGTATGQLWYSQDGGTTWTRRTGFTNDGVGQIRSMHWLDEFTGWINHNNASPVGETRYTTDGGKDWIDITTATNEGLNAVWAVRNNLAYQVGEVVAAGTGFVGKISNKNSSV